MSNYIKLINNLEILKLEKVKQNIDQYIDLINGKKKDIVDALYELTNLEIELRNEKAMYGCVRTAGFPFLKMCFPGNAPSINNVPSSNKTQLQLSAIMPFAFNSFSLSDGITF